MTTRELEIFVKVGKVEIVEGDDGNGVVILTEKTPSLEKAFQWSIDKWNAITLFHEQYPDMKIAGYRGGSCALCDYERDCARCPVYHVTGKMQCAGTPYRDYTSNKTAENARRMVADLKRIRNYFFKNYVVLFNGVITPLKKE